MMLKREIIWNEPALDAYVSARTRGRGDKVGVSVREVLDHRR